ncbi:hypothetical protein TRIP_C60038 [Candidatus Zixiibacteriota bacterium]|nr:hypothetical protein TRIP_C60038 [candidate division Zixibacteria bacterium]
MDMYSKFIKYLQIMCVCETIAIFAAGCANTSLKSYLTDEGKDPEITFGGYRIDIQFSKTAFIASACADSLILFIQTSYINNIQNSLNIDSIEVLKLDSFYFEIPMYGKFLTPKLTKYGLRPTKLVQGKRVFGPSYQFQPIFMSNEIKEIKLHFVAHLYNASSGIEILSSPYEIKLYRINKKKFLLITDGLCNI